MLARVVAVGLLWRDLIWEMSANISPRCGGGVAILLRNP